MNDTKKQPIGDPLALAAQTGMLGTRRPITSTDRTPVQEAPVAKNPRKTASRKREKRESIQESEKKTITFEGEMAYWLEIQAAVERRDMSRIVHDGLLLYRKFKDESTN